MPTPKLFLAILTNSAEPERTIKIRRDTNGAVICWLGAEGRARGKSIKQVTAKFNAFIRGPRSFLFWRKDGLLKKLNEKYQKEAQQGSNHIIYPSSTTGSTSNEFKRGNNANYYITIKINPAATITQVKEWLLDIGFAMIDPVVQNHGETINENALIGSEVDRLDQIMQDRVAALAEQERLERLGAEFVEVEPFEKEIPKMTDYIKSVSIAEQKKIFASFNKKVKSIQVARQEQQAEEGAAGQAKKIIEVCEFTHEEIILEADNATKYIMILTYDETNKTNQYNVSFFRPDPTMSETAMSETAIIKHLSQYHTIIDPITNKPLFASNPITGVPIYLLHPTTRQPVLYFDRIIGAEVKKRAVVKQHFDLHRTKIMSLATGTFDELSKMMRNLMPEAVLDADKQATNTKRASKSWSIHWPYKYKSETTQDIVPAMDADAEQLEAKASKRRSYSHSKRSKNNKKRHNSI